MDRIGFGIIGCGYQTLRNMGPALVKCDKTKLVGCFDTNPERAKAASVKFGGTPYESLENLLADSRIKAVYIATPIATHAEICLAAAAAGKHILCEKTLAMNPQQTKTVIEACRSRGLVLEEGFMYKHHTQHKFVRDIIDSGELGEALLFQAWFGFPPFPEQDFRMRKDMGGGVILDAGAYTVHAARTFFSREPIRIFSSVSYNKQGLDMHGSVLMEFGGRQTAQLNFGMDNAYKNSYSIWCSKGEIWLKRAFSIPSFEIPVCYIKTQGLIREYQLAPCDHFEMELQSFCRSIESGVYDYEDISNQAAALYEVRQQSGCCPEGEA